MNERIYSSSNSKVKHVRRLQYDRRYRRREQQYVVEGERWIRDLVQSGQQPLMLFATLVWQEVALPDDWPLIFVTQEVMQSMSAVETSPGLLAVVGIQQQPVPEEPSLLLILDRVQNPGNMGTMLRTAAAAGADGVMLLPGCVDVYNPKVVRGAMGAHLRIPLHEVDALDALDLQLYYADAEAEQRYIDIDWRQASGLIIGNEAHGVSDDLRRTAQGVRIPMAHATESLNAAVAAAVILFEAARQRHFRPPERERGLI